MRYQGKSALPAWASACPISPVSFLQGQGGAEGIWPCVCVCVGGEGPGQVTFRVSDDPPANQVFAVPSLMGCLS